ncbi:MAG: homoaconitate hydratase [Thermoplasmatales archaeon]|nr:MAG: homoaconitate hydratase [Thermoplasmatales archaeon]
MIDFKIDVRAARDFGGANVVKNLEENNLSIDDSNKTYFTFDCNPGGCDQKYAANQQICRMYARRHNIKVFDIDSGIGTHLVIDEKIAKPGGTIVSTDSHANILGAIGAFGQGMGDKDITHAWAYGKIWFKVPPTIKIILKGKPSNLASPKDIVLKLLQVFGANGLLGYAAEIYGEYVDSLSLDGRITIASMATEMGGIILLFSYKDGVKADSDAVYENTVEIDIQDIKPLISRPGHPEDVVSIDEVLGEKVDSGFIGSCTNGRIDDMRAVAKILKGKKIATGRILKIVPSTDKIWKKCLDEGLIKIFKEAGALVGSAGCAGCAAGQIGQTGSGEIAVSSGNRNFLGKQGKGDIYLASPETVAASLLAGYITTVEKIPKKAESVKVEKSQIFKSKPKGISKKPSLKAEGKAWVIKKDNIDTDMIFHNRYLSITNIDEMGQYTFDNLEGYEDFAKKVKLGDILIVGKNFGCGSSRQQAVDCFKSLGISVIIAESFGAIYERNAINNAMPILVSEDITSKIMNYDQLIVDYTTGEIKDLTQNKTYYSKTFSKSQLEIYKRGGLLNI